MLGSVGHPVVASVPVGTRTPQEMQSNFDHMAAPIPAGFRAALKERGVLREDVPVPQP